MKKVIYTNLGGFPLTQNTLNHMQDAYGEINSLIASMKGINGPGNFILTGAINDAGTISGGWLFVDGELIRLTGGVGSYIDIKQQNTTETFEDNGNHVTLTYKWAEVQTSALGTSVALYSDYERVYEYLEWIQVTNAPDLFCAKDNHGFVHLKGRFTNLQGNIRNLPIGYMPAVSSQFPIVVSVSATITVGVVFISGINGVNPGSIAMSPMPTNDYSVEHIKFLPAWS